LEHIFLLTTEKNTHDRRKERGSDGGRNTHKNTKRGNYHYFMECDDVLGVKKERGLVFDATHRVE